MTTEYAIEGFYQSGDSFNTYDTSTMLEMRWKDLDKAKAALKRIKEHYLWYRDVNKYSYKPREQELLEPEWHRGMKYDFSVKVALDNGNDVQFTAPWCGYFERLDTAKIVVVSGKADNDMEVNF